MAEELGSAVLRLEVEDERFITRLSASKKLVDTLFNRDYRLKVNDTQVIAANDRLDTTARKLREITSKPYNVRLNFVQSGFGTGGGGKLSVGGVQKQIQEILQGGLSGELQDILRGGAQAVGGARTEELRKSLLARLERSSLGKGGFNLPGLEEIIRSLGEVPQARAAGRAALVDQARRVVQSASDAVINRIGQDLLDLQLNLNRAVGQGAGGGAGAGSPTAANRLLGPVGSTGGRVLLTPQQPAVPETLGREFERLGDLRRVLNSAEIGSNEFAAALSEIEVVQRRVAQATDGVSEAFRRQQQAAEGAARRAEKIANIQNYNAEIASRAGGFRDPNTGAMLARGAGAVSDERAYNAAIRPARELLELELARNRAIRERQQALAAATQQREVSQAEGFAARPTAVEKSIRRNQERVARQRARDERQQARQAAEQQEAEDILESTLARVRQRRERVQREAAAAETRAARQAEQRRTGLRNRGRDVLSNALIGGAFPPLFGQGLGASAGGLLGGGAGGAIGGQFGFGLSLIGTALGAQFDLAIEKAKTLGQALRDPIGQFDALQQAALLSSRGLERQVQGLIKTGREAEAAALIQADLAQAYGDTKAYAELNNAFDQLNRAVAQLSIGVVQFAAGPLTDFINRLNGALRLSPERQRAISTEAGNAVQQAIGPFGGSGFFGGVDLQFQGRRFQGSAAGVRQAIIDFRTQQELQKDQAKIAAQLTRQAAPQREQGFADRASLLTKELQLISAQTQGYTQLAIEAEKSLSIERERVDLERLRATNASSAELEQRRTEGQRERFRLDEQLARQERISEARLAFRGPLLQTQLALIAAQTTGEERRALVLQRQLITLEAQRKIREDPGTAGQTRDQALVDVARINAQIAEFDRKRAADLRTISVEYALQTRTLGEQLQFARQRGALEAGVLRTNLEQRQAVEETVTQARNRIQQLIGQFVNARALGDDLTATRVFTELRGAGTELEIALTNGATALRDAALELTRSSEALSLDLSNAVTGFTALRARPDGLNQYLPPEARSQREIQNFNLLLPFFRQAQARFRDLTGVQAPEFAGPTGGVNAAVEKFIQNVNAEVTARQNVGEIQRNLAETNTALAATNRDLATALNRLADKQWGVEVNVAADGTTQAIGDILNQALGAAQ